jgi:hypothetical protein
MLQRMPDCTLQLEDIVSQARRESEWHYQNFDFSTNGVATVSLGDMIHYSSSPDCGTQVVRATHIVSDSYKSDLLKADHRKSKSLSWLLSP